MGTADELRLETAGVLGLALGVTTPGCSEVLGLGTVSVLETWDVLAIGTADVLAVGTADELRLETAGVLRLALGVTTPGCSGGVSGTC